MRTLDYKSLFLVSVCLLLLCIASVVVLTLPVFTEKFGGAAAIGDAIGGITAPIVGIFTAVLLYITLSHQVESNIDQRLKNESDMIFLLINQFENEVRDFYLTYRVNGIESRYSGIEGLNHFGHRLKFELAKNNLNISFRNFYESNQIVLLVESFQLIESRINTAAISNDLKSVFSQKLKILYRCRLRGPLNAIADALETNPRLKDCITDMLMEFREKERVG